MRNINQKEVISKYAVSGHVDKSMCSLFDTLQCFLSGLRSLGFNGFLAKSLIEKKLESSSTSGEKAKD